MCGRKQHLSSKQRTQPPDRALVTTLRSVDRVQAQNALMTSSDRDLALALMYLEDRERAAVFARVSPAKAARVHSELLLQQRLRIEYRQYLDAVERVISRLRGAGRRSGVASYLRPRRTGRQIS